MKNDDLCANSNTIDVFEMVQKKRRKKRRVEKKES